VTSKIGSENVNIAVITSRVERPITDINSGIFGPSSSFGVGGGGRLKTTEGEPAVDVVVVVVIVVVVVVVVR